MIAIELLDKLAQEIYGEFGYATLNEAEMIVVVNEAIKIVNKG